MRHLLTTTLAAACVLGFAAPAFAQDVASQPEALRDFCANRPGKGTPTCILDQGHFQFEVRLVDGARQRDDAFKVESWGYGDTFVRYGLTP